MNINKQIDEILLLSGNIISESIFWRGERINNYEDGYYNYDNADYDKDDEMIVWLNPSKEWVKHKLKSGEYFRFVYDSDDNKLYMWYGEDGFHMNTMDIVGIDGDIVGTLTAGGIDYWADNDTLDTVNNKFYKHKKDMLDYIFSKKEYDYGIQY